MKWWRRGVGLVLVLFVALPAALPFVELLHRPAAWAVWTEFDRLLALSRNTFLLAGGTLVLALPAGVLLGVVLYRTDLPGRHLLRWPLLLPLFIPLPLLVAGWEPVLSKCPLQLAGLTAAIVLHTLAALPWVVVVTGLGLCHVERAAEEDALTAAPARRVLLLVTLPRAAPALVAAALWVFVQTSTEIGIADLFQVRTFAEEVYTQFVRPEGDSTRDVDLLAARAVAVAVPSLAMTIWLVLVLVRRAEQCWPPLFGLSRPLLFPLGRMRVMAGLSVALATVALAGIPVVGLLWRTGLAGTPPGWTLPTAIEQLGRAWHQAAPLGEALLLAGWVGIQTATLALLACWLSRQQGGFRSLVLCVGVVVWLLPGPAVGLGMKRAIHWLAICSESPFLADVLYHGPSWLPVAWVQTIRLLPFALALLWTTVRSLPRDLLETARVEGASPASELRLIVMPLTRTAWVRCVAIVGAISLGEVSATKLVSTPGATPFSQYVFEQLHYGSGADLAARCLLLLAAVILFAVASRRLLAPGADASGSP